MGLGPSRTYARADATRPRTPNRRADVDALRAVIADVEMIALYVFVKREGRWMIAARQNTLVAA